MEIMAELLLCLTIAKMEVVVGLVVQVVTAARPLEEPGAMDWNMKHFLRLVVRLPAGLLEEEEEVLEQPLVQAVKAVVVWEETLMVKELAELQIPAAVVVEVDNGFMPVLSAAPAS
ncbi:MAG: hypothetical protein L6455_12695 [Kiritimatiellae bacterium]|nr:hypothetical protein [Kiritimatiellia bacterium]